MQLLGINVLKEGFFGVLLTFDTIIYGLIGGAFKVFMAVAKARLLTSDAYYAVATRVYLLVGVLMLFVLSYAILRAIIDPDQATKGELGPKMIQRVVIAVVGLAITPAIFNLLYQAQGLFMEKDVLAKIFFTKNSKIQVQDANSGETVNVDQQIQKIGGAVTATSIWQAFFSPADGYSAEDIKTNAAEYFAEGALAAIGCVAGIATSAAIATGALVIPVIGWIVAPLILGATILSCVNAYGDISAGAAASSAAGGTDITLDRAYALTSGGGSFSIYVAFLHNYVDDKEINYLFLISTICGLFVLYSFLSFTIDMGIRAAKLAYLQVVAPVPLVMQVLPKYRDTFTKWYKSVFSAFAEVFIRISVVYIVVYVICHLSDVFSAISKGFANSDLNTLEAALAYAALIMGLIAFCRKAPNIIQQTLGISGGDLKFGLGEKLKDGGVFAAAGIGAGGVTGAVRRFKNFDEKAWRERNPGADAKMAKLARVMSGVGGLGAGAGRATWNQFGDVFGGKPKNEANNWHDAMEVGEKAAQQHMDANAKAEARKKQHHAALEDIRKAEAELRTAGINQTAANNALQAAEAALAANPTDAGLIAARDAAKVAADAANKEYRAKEAAVADAQKRSIETTAPGAWAEEQKRKITAWSTGSVDMSFEEEALQVASAVKGLQDTLRAEALKKDETSKSLNAEYERLMKETVSDYRAGWDEETYNKAVHSALEADAAYTGARAAYETARQDYATATAAANAARLAAEADPTNAALQAAYASAQAAAVSARTDMDSKMSSMETERTRVVNPIDAQAKLSDDEKAVARADLQARVDAAKAVSEAAQDAWVQTKLATGDNELSQIVEAAVTPHLEFLQTHGNDKVVVDIDGSGVETEISLSDLVAGHFGTTVVTDGKVSASAVAAESQFVFKDGSTTLTTFDYNPTTKIYTDTTTGQTYNPGEMSAHITSLMRSYKQSHPTSEVKFESNTAVSRAKDQGKKVGINTPRSASYRNKIQRKRQAQEGKK